MLQHTFCHVPGVGPKTEAGLWRRGTLNWADFLNAQPRPAIRGKVASAQLMAEWLERSQAALERRDAEFFATALPAAEVWRLASHFGQDAAYVDIETTGLGQDAQITSIALYDGTQVRTYVQGRNLADFEADIGAYALLVTFNGRCFDAPILEQHFNIRLPRAHIDLRFVLRAMGLRGGLKVCEQRLGLQREGLEGLDGYFAVLLWHEYETYGDEDALETLLAYNAADVLGLPELLRQAYNQRLASTGLNLPAMAPLAPGRNPHEPSPEVIARIRARHGL